MAGPFDAKNGKRSSENTRCNRQRKFWTRQWELLANTKLIAPEKKRHFIPLLQTFDQEGKIGNAILDVGSGPNPVSSFLYTPTTKPQRKIVQIDIGAHDEQNATTLIVSYAIEKLADRSPETQSVLQKIASFLATSSVSMDSVIISEVLNYIDYQQVLSHLSQYIKPFGRLFIFNRAHVGFHQLFSDTRPMTGREVTDFLVKNNFEIEFEQDVAPFYRRGKGTIPATGPDIIVAKKLPNKIPPF